MNKTLALALIGLVGLSGCVSSHFHQQGKSDKQTQAGALPRPIAPVTASQATRENAHQLSEALWDEMDREAQQEPLGKNSPSQASCRH